MRAIFLSISIALMLAGCDGKSVSETKPASVSETKPANEFPYYAVVMCGNEEENYEISAYVCFVHERGNSHTELEIRNGPDYKVNTWLDLQGMTIKDENRRDKLVIDLRSQYRIVAQNAKDNNHLLLYLKIYDRETNQLLFKQKAGYFEVIDVSN